MDAHKLKHHALPYLLILLAWVWSLPAFAQELPVLELSHPVEGQIDSGGSQTWSFSAPEGAVRSFVVRAESSDLDPIISLQNSAGTELITIDDYHPDSTDALLSTITIPRRDEYRVTVSGFGSTSGTYTLTMRPGYAHIAWDETFEGQSTWQPQSDDLESVLADGQLTLSLAGIGKIGLASSLDSPLLQDFYTRVQVSDISDGNGWLVGVTFRETAAGYYALVINNQGFWRLLHYADGEEHILQDWMPHPAIIPGETRFTLGIMAYDTAFDLFYNGQFIGQAVDTAPPESGSVGLLIGTANEFGSEVTAQFDQLLITVPSVIDQSTVPQRLMPGSPVQIVQELERQQLIPPGGRQVLTVPESSAQNINPGVTRLSLGRGVTYENFVVDTKVSWQINDFVIAGCGLALRSVDDSHYLLAYIDQAGGYGLSQREGDTFLPGIFGELPAEATGADSYDLLIVANDTTLYYYIDNQYRGTLTSPAVAGELANAVVNFDPTTTACSYRDTWLWTWDE